MMVTMKVTIHDVAPLALTLLVDFSYTGELVVSEDNVQVSVLPIIRIFHHWDWETINSFL